MKTLVLSALGVLCLAGGVYVRRGLPARPPSGRALEVARRWASEAARMRFSTDGLYEAAPEASARHTLSDRQRDGLVAFGCALATALLVSPHLTLVTIVAVVTLLYGGSVATRLWLFALSLGGTDMVSVPDGEARQAADETLPAYTVLVPAFGEPEVMAPLVANLRSLQYPPARLQVVLLVEVDDTPTLVAARTAIGAKDDIEVLLVPPGGPRTKPKALNYGLTRATGELLTIFDAEDRPDPLQLRKAAVAFSRADKDVACLQGRLGFFNAGQNLITRWFEVEYSMWFRQLLPGLSRVKAPIPLGGTSNHFRTSVLLQLGAWDPDNVTEDADLGLRLARAGYHSEVLDSVTLEEANSDFVNWAKQRSRWYKGYLQTFLVHMRDVRAARRALGTRQFMLFGFLVGGTPLMAVVNPVFWVLTLVWFTLSPQWLKTLYPAPIYYLGLLCWLGGNFAFTFTSILEAIEVNDSLFVAALLTPLYWVMMALAAGKAFFQVIFAPNYWEKTRHGLGPDVNSEVSPSSIGPVSAGAGA